MLGIALVVLPLFLDLPTDDMHTWKEAALVCMLHTSGGSSTDHRDNPDLSSGV